MQQKNSPLQHLLYLPFLLAFLALFFVGNNGEPYGLSLLYAMASARLSPLLSALLYFLPSLISGNPLVILLYAGQALLLFFAFFMQKKFSHIPFYKSNFLPLFFLAIGLGSFVAFAPFTPIPLAVEGFAETAIFQKTILAALIFLLSASFSVGIKALLQKFLRCKLRIDETVFLCLFFLFVGVGVCRLFGLNAYMGISFFILLLFFCLTKDALGMLCAFVISLPPFLVARLSPDRFFVYGAMIFLFIKYGRLPAVCATLATFFAYGYFDGIYSYPATQLVPAILSVLLPCLFFVLLPTALIRFLENKVLFYREKHLTRIAINRNRAAIGEKLFELSAVFREIENTFSSLNSTDAEENAKKYIGDSLMEKVCAECPQRLHCQRKGISQDIKNVIDIGCMKGKLTVIDLPNGLATGCLKQTELVQAINKQLVDYHKYMLETENAIIGRELLASQAQGVSEILKELALEQSEPLRIHSEKERALNLALLTIGIVCSEVLIYGEIDAPTLSLITFGKADVKKIAAVASHLFDCDMIISERITLSDNKFCCILRKKPHFDAAFGIATVAKKGVYASGDTHSVIKIDERRFLVALSDGMGSGEFAKRVSESTISLLESFYRAKMPSDLALSTVNRLLSFSKEETFACVDIAVVNLDTGVADVVKIGSPTGFILSGSAVKVLEGSCLPLGALEAMRPETATYTLAENDVLLFLSDGITDAFGSTSDLYEILKTIPTQNPQQLADELLQRAITAYGGTRKDDMTVVAVRLFVR